MASQRVAPQKPISQQGYFWVGWSVDVGAGATPALVTANHRNASSLRCDPQGRWESRSFNGEDSLSQGALSW